MDIRTAMNALQSIQLGLAITEPFPLAVKEAYKFVPKANQVISPPAWVNNWTLNRVDGPGGQYRKQYYTVAMNLYAMPAAPDADIATDVASAFHAAFVDALDLKVNLSGTVSVATLRGADPTLGILERGGVSYIGLSLFLDLLMGEPRTFSV